MYVFSSKFTLKRPSMNKCTELLHMVKMPSKWTSNTINRCAPNSRTFRTFVVVQSCMENCKIDKIKEREREKMHSSWIDLWMKKKKIEPRKRVSEISNTKCVRSRRKFETCAMCKQWCCAMNEEKVLCQRNCDKQWQPDLKIYSYAIFFPCRLK